MKVIEPPNSPNPILPNDDSGSDSNAANLIRKKLNSIYSEEPDAVTEAIESIQEPAKDRSKHQRFMADLASSGKPFAQIQTEWHEYYSKLPNKEKHEVWNEFYNVQGHKPGFSEKQVPIVEEQTQVLVEPIKPTSNSYKPSTMAEAKNKITSSIKKQTKLPKSHHFKSLMFGLSAGVFTVVLMLFGFFNERFIAPFITPSKNVSSTPLIADSLSGEVSGEPKLIIPKINVELPVVYDVPTIEENAIQSGLERGVVHYATTSNPGEQGNGAIFGHSSNNILNKGQYKFAFVLLSRLEPGDTFYIEKDKVRYVYKIFDKKIVSPSEVSILGDVAGKTSTMSLITCDPPGTTINRLVVFGEQISPDPSTNVASTATKADSEPEKLAGNPDSLWSRMWNSVF